MNAARIERQLKALPEGKFTAGLAAGIWATLYQNPILATMLGPSQFTAIAAIYGHCLRVCREVIEQPNQNPEVLADAQRTLDLMQQIAVLVDAPDPEPPQPMGMIGADLGDMLKDIVSRYGGVGSVTPSVPPEGQES